MSYGLLLMNDLNFSMYYEGADMYQYYGKYDLTVSQAAKVHTQALFNIPDSVPIQVFCSTSDSGTLGQLTSFGGKWEMRCTNVKGFGDSQISIYVFIPARYIKRSASYGIEVYDNTGATVFHGNRPTLNFVAIDIVIGRNYPHNIACQNMPVSWAQSDESFGSQEFLVATLIANKTHLTTREVLHFNTAKPWVDAHKGMDFTTKISRHAVINSDLCRNAPNLPNYS